MKISLDNGNTFENAIEAMPEITKYNLWETIVQNMDDEVREQVHNAIAPCTDLEFLEEYLRTADNDLIIG